VRGLGSGQAARLARRIAAPLLAGEGVVRGTAVLAGEGVEWGTAVLARGASHLLRAVPVPLRYAPADALTALLARVWADRRLVARNYAVITGLAPDHPVVRALAGRSLSNFGRMAVDFLAACTMPPDELLRWVTPVGETYVAEARAAGRGVIFAMPHLGSWDVAGAYAAADGIPLTVVVENDVTARLVAGARAYQGVKLIALGRSPRALFAALRRNEGVVLISDIAHDGVPVARVPFFGRAAAFPTGPAELALRTGAPIIVLGCMRLDDGSYRIEGQPPLWPEVAGAVINDRQTDRAVVNDRRTAGTVNGAEGGRAHSRTGAPHGHEPPSSDAVRALTARVVAGFERLIARYPDHWYPFHQVWDEPLPHDSDSSSSHA
jgi:KDO2-lipid IV(A) lauroyltransferase